MNYLFAKLYEFFGLCYFEGFSDNLFDSGVYTSTGFSTLVLTILSMIIFYLLKKQKPLTFRIFVYWIWVLVISIICFGLAYILSRSTLYGVYAEQNQDLPYGFGSFAGFALINVFWAFVFCLFTSIVIQLFFIETHGNVPFSFRKSHK